jgi:cytochrome c biogenesis protein CcdA
VIETVGFAAAAGLVAALNPCGFALLPGYLGLVLAGGGSEWSRRTALARACLATVAMSAGFLTVFGVFGLVIAPVVASAQKYLPFATVVVGLSLTVVAVLLLAGKDITVVVPQLPVASPSARLSSMYGYGLGYATASLSCTIAPFLAVVGTTFKQRSIPAGVLAFVAYAGGMATTVGLAALTVALAGSAAAGALRRILPHVGRIVGFIVLLTGLYVTYYGYYEIRLYFADATPDDPIIKGAGAVQGWLAGQVDRLGVWSLLGMFAALTAIAIGWRILTRRRSPRPQQ